nr:DUF2730 family protein [Neoroseomonas eburnea]
MVWIVAVAAAVGGLLLAFLRFKLAGDFAKAPDLAALTGRVGMIEQRVAQMPNHEDLRALQSRVGDLERGVAVVAEKVSGVAEIMKRVEHQTNLLVHHQLREGSGG